MRQLFIALGLAPIVLALPQNAQAVAVNMKVPIDISVFVPCANGGGGEDVTLTGNVHIEASINFDNAGGGHLHFTANPQGVSGEGSVTGDKYQGTGVTEESINFKTGIESTFVNRFDIIGQGPGNNFELHETAHVTVNANGTLTVSFSNFSAICR
jgi:hypothetical protein